ncbi:MAG: cysteine hydrolase [Methyloversatilis sp.]|jgi:nicotinamidase-related amidase|uniref:Isochorismatase hydrolase n=1 Tax=Methyloversatilis universalis (strain ATCC BAA-1314 / DSM 25237 / JCM 13912 / CCUG 52030 / FAM5) TaxID=1000565 RepID=F5RDZ9_METUF|nr:cysteine hydrolase family protein [Methyloversatilis universalis]EGK71130.1 Isochorismatase hydrolase [Methyloversatilis universalis FAM5]MCP4638657.1 cysteine hydrolase [Methyloversatilis sp.]
MTAPTTLRDLMGLGHQPCTLQDAALVMIDCQNTYREGIMQLTGVEPALKEARRVLDRARALGRPVIHIQHDAGPGTPYDVRADIGRIADIVAPQNGETVITKGYPNSFVQTPLDDELKRLGVKNLVLVGFMTHMCVNSTARGAFNLGYAPTVVASATATRDLPLPDGSLVRADALQPASIATMRDLFAAIAPTADAVLG